MKFAVFVFLLIMISYPIVSREQKGRKGIGFCDKKMEYLQLLSHLRKFEKLMALKDFQFSHFFHDVKG